MPDPEMTALMRALPLGEAQAVEWYTALRESCDRAPDDFGEAIAALGAATSHFVSPAELDLFVEELDRLTADRMEFLRRFAEEDPHDLAAHHAAEHTAEHAEPEHQPAEEGPFDWVPAEQAERMAQAWGQDWPQALDQQLAHQWGADWQQHPADHKAAWLPELLDTLLSPEAPSPEQPAHDQGRFDWVPAEQAERMAQAWGQDWPEVLGPQLDYRWGQGWEAHPADDKAAWLPALVDEFLAPAAEPDGPEPQGAGDVAAEEIKAAVDEVVAEIPGAENLTEAQLRQIRAEVAAALAGEPAPAG